MFFFARAVWFAVLHFLLWSVCARSERYYDDVDEMRAFMSMFMELVGMFGSDIPTMPNGCGPDCKGGHAHVPPGESERASENK